MVERVFLNRPPPPPRKLYTTHINKLALFRLVVVAGFIFDLLGNGSNEENV